MRAHSRMTRTVIAAVSALLSTGVHAALYQLTTSATGTVSVDGAPPGPPDTIVITAIGDTARAIDVTPSPSLPFSSAISWPLDRLSFSATGISGDFMGAGTFEHSFFSPSTHGASFTGGGPSLVLFLVPLSPRWVFSPTPFALDLAVYSAAPGSHALASGHTVEYRYTAVGSEYMRFTAVPAAVPEPATMALLLAGLVALGRRGWRSGMPSLQ